MLCIAPENLRYACKIKSILSAFSLILIEFTYQSCAAFRAGAPLRIDAKHCSTFLSVAFSSSGAVLRAMGTKIFEISVPINATFSPRFPCILNFVMMQGEKTFNSILFTRLLSLVSPTPASFFA